MLSIFFLTMIITLNFRLIGTLEVDIESALVKNILYSITGLSKEYQCT